LRVCYNSSSCICFYLYLGAAATCAAFAQVLQLQPQATAVPDAENNANPADSNNSAIGSATAATPSEAVQLVEYVVTVHTGTALGAGTDGDVFLALTGERGSLGERQLTNSSTNMNKFERGTHCCLGLPVTELSVTAMHVCSCV
jgi:hypothetical protein